MFETATKANAARLDCATISKHGINLTADQQDHIGTHRLTVQYDPDRRVIRIRPSNGSVRETFIGSRPNNMTDRMRVRLGTRLIDMLIASGVSLSRVCDLNKEIRRDGGIIDFQL